MATQKPKKQRGGERQKKENTLSPEEIRTQLFDGLMLQIEPDLAICNRAETAEKFAGISTEERQEWMGHYEQAFALFFENWPRYIAAAMSGVAELTEALHQEISLREKGTLERLEQELQSSDDAA